MSITYRKDLDRVLTSDEVDNNFLELETVNNNQNDVLQSMRRPFKRLVFPEDGLSYKVTAFRVAIEPHDDGGNQSYLFSCKLSYNFFQYGYDTSETYLNFGFGVNDTPSSVVLSNVDLSTIEIVPASDFSYFDICFIREASESYPLLELDMYLDYFNQGLTFLDDFDTSIVEVV